MQGLRGCRNAGIPVPKEIIDKAVKYIRKCTGADGGVQYNSKGGGGRPPITAAAIACLFNAGDYDDKYVPKLLDYCEQNLADVSKNDFGPLALRPLLLLPGALPRRAARRGRSIATRSTPQLVGEANPDGYWDQGYMGPVYTTAMNLTILQLERGVLPIYQR